MNKKILAVVITIILLSLIFTVGEMKGQEKGKPVPQDTVFAVKQSTLDTRIAAYEKHILDLQEDFKATQIVLSELKSLRMQIDTITTKKERVKK